MYSKKILISIIFIFSFFFFSSKISAITIAECNYENESLLLPVTIGVEIKGYYIYNPLDGSKNINETIELFVYDELTCEQSLFFYKNNNWYNIRFNV